MYMSVCVRACVHNVNDGEHAPQSDVNAPLSPLVSGKPVSAQFFKHDCGFSQVSLCLSLFFSVFLNEWAQKTQTSAPHFLLYRFLSIGFISLSLTLSLWDVQTCWLSYGSYKWIPVYFQSVCALTCTITLLFSWVIIILFADLDNSKLLWHVDPIFLIFLDSAHLEPNLNIHLFLPKRHKQTQKQIYSHTSGSPKLYTCFVGMAICIQLQC